MEYVITRFSDSNELMHYGVKGMKWGVRRAQQKYVKKAQQQIDMNLNNVKSIKSELKTDRSGFLALDNTNETRKSYTHEQRRAIETAKHWTNTQKRIMEKTTVADIKNEYKNAIKNAKVYYPF